MDKGSWVNGEWCSNWDWKRCIRGRVCQELDDVVGILQNVVVSNNCRDTWKWLIFDDDKFKVKELSSMIEEEILRMESGGQETLWNKLVPKKVNIFVWRALKGRLPVREELDKRGIDLDSMLCPSCNNEVESCAHCLVTCDLARSVWDKIFSWWKMGELMLFPLMNFSHFMETLMSLTIFLVFGKRSFGHPTITFGTKEMRVCSLEKWQVLINRSRYSIKKLSGLYGDQRNTK